MPFKSLHNPAKQHYDMADAQPGHLAKRAAANDGERLKVLGAQALALQARDVALTRLQLRQDAAALCLRQRLALQLPLQARAPVCASACTQTPAQTDAMLHPHPQAVMQPLLQAHAPAPYASMCVELHKGAAVLRLHQQLLPQPCSTRKRPHALLSC